MSSEGSISRDLRSGKKLTADVKKTEENLKSRDNLDMESNKSKKENSKKSSTKNSVRRMRIQAEIEAHEKLEKIEEEKERIKIQRLERMQRKIMLELELKNAMASDESESNEEKSNINFDEVDSRFKNSRVQKWIDNVSYFEKHEEREKDRDRSKHSSSKDEDGKNDKDKSRHSSSKDKNRDKNKHSSSEDKEKMKKQEKIEEPKEEVFEPKRDPDSAADDSVNYDSIVDEDDFKLSIKEDVDIKNEPDSQEEGDDVNLSQGSSCDYIMSQFSKSEPAFEEEDDEGKPNVEEELEEESEEDISLSARKSTSKRKMIDSEEDEDAIPFSMSKKPNWKRRKRKKIMSDNDEEGDYAPTKIVEKKKKHNMVYDKRRKFLKG